MHRLKRVAFFLCINCIVVLTISAILSLCKISGIESHSLLLFCFVWGMVGALISLAFSRQFAKRLMGVETIDPATAMGRDRQLLELVKRHALDAGLSHIPEVGIFPSSHPNAFATGPSKKRSLIAVSSGLLDRMDARELSAIIGHEMAHISNGDMVTMTLIQGIINAFVMFLARVLASVFTSGRNGRRNHAPHFSLLTLFFETAFMLFGSIAIAFFSRIREFRADREGAILAGKESMIAALSKLQHPSHKSHRFMRGLMISQSTRGGWFFSLFATHPPIDVRIARLKELP